MTTVIHLFLKVKLERKFLIESEAGAKVFYPKQSYRLRGAPKNKPAAGVVAAGAGVEMTRVTSGRRSSCEQRALK